MQVEEIFIWELNERKRHARLRQICINLRTVTFFKHVIQRLSLGKFIHSLMCELVKIQSKLFMKKNLVK